MMTQTEHCLKWALLCFSLGLHPGCATPTAAEPPAPAAPAGSPQDAISRLTRSAAIRDTVGAYTWTEGLRKLRVHGYGLVVGLGQNGSRTCPERTRKQLIAEIRKKYRLGDSRIGLGDITPEMLIDSADTAEVEVQGEIGAAALSGTKFDLVVQALPGTETTSLEGGRLYTCDLQYYAELGDGTTQKGKAVATGEGPVFINPFSHGDDAADARSLRSGKIIGGGSSLENRVVRLKLASPSYSRAIAIQDKINDRFGLGQKIATADSPWQVSLQIPRRYTGRELYFLALVRHLSLIPDSAADQRRVMELIAELSDPAAPHDNIGLALEASGETVRPLLRPLYEHKLPHVSYYAARTGLHLRDNLAITPLSRHAVDPESPYQMEAIRELSDALEMPRATQGLHSVASSSDDSKMRAMACEGLVKHADPAVSSTLIGGQFYLDRMPDSAGNPLIYGKVLDNPRLAIIGHAPLKVPVLYRHPAELVAIHAEPGDSAVTVVRTTPSGRLSPPVTAPLDLAALVTLLAGKAAESRDGNITGLGLSYSQVLDVVSSLCQSGAVDAEFRLEKPEADDLSRVRSLRSRPESEL